MKRRGIILFELLLYILLMSVAAAVLLPAVGRMMRTLDILHNSVEMTEQAVFSMDFMTEKIRNTLGRTENSRRGNTFEYRAYNEYKKNAPYRFMIKDEKLKVVLYNGKSQPVTGKTSERKEEIAFKPPEGDKMFHVCENGLTEISFEMAHHRSGRKLYVKTAILPYRDFYRGKPGSEYKNGKA